METLEKLFSSKPLIKIMRMFFFNPHTPFDIDDIVTRTKTKRTSVQFELRLLQSIGFLKRRKYYKTLSKQVGKKTTTSKKKVNGWILDETFPYLLPLRALIVDTELIDEGHVTKRLKKVGNIQLALISGVFLQHSQSRVDLLIVGNKMRRAALDTAIADLEAAIGTELRFTLLTPEEFKYRLDVSDRLIRDVLESPHEMIINKFGNTRPY